MLILTYLFITGFIMSTVGVSSNPSPCYAALSLVCMSCAGAGALIMCGALFLALMVILIYVGGMLVAFAFSVNMASEVYPNFWTNKAVLMSVVAQWILVLCVVSWFFCLVGDGFNMLEDGKDLGITREDFEGSAVLYSWGGWGLIAAVWALLLSLLVVLQVSWGASRGALRAV